MPKGDTDTGRAEPSRIEQARAMLELFEGDRRRPAETLDELKEWANAQDDEQLRFRVNRHLHFRLDGRAAHP